MRDTCAIAGVGTTEYYKRGQSYPETELSMACTAILAALDDAGLTINDLDGFSIYSSSCDPATVGAELGVPEIRWATSTTSGGGGCVGALGVAAAAIETGQATTIVSLMTLQQLNKRLGGSAVGGMLQYAMMSDAGGSPYGGSGISPAAAFTANNGLLSPGHSFAQIVSRHMHLYGTAREQIAEVALSSRKNAATNPRALRPEPLTMDDYFNARMINDPLCLFDYTMESDGAVAVITTSTERARDLKQAPVLISAASHGGTGRWGPALFKYFQTPDEFFPTSGHRPVANRMYEMAGVGPSDVDVALLYDHFAPMVMIQLEDYGFCPVGEGGPFLADGNIRYGTGSIPVNPHGGNLSEAYIIGMTHVREAVEQLRGTAANQVDGAEVALVTGGPAGLPVSGAILRKDV